MDYSSASSFVYSKACGMLGKSFVGENAQKLFDARSLSELWELIFKTPAPQTPEVMLANHLEYEAIRKFVKEYTTLLSYYDKPHSFLIALLTRYEVENLKTISASLGWNEQKQPRFVNLGEYQILHIEKWPDIAKITEGTPFEWYNQVPPQNEHWEWDYKLDLKEFQYLWKELNKIHDSSRQDLFNYVQKDYALKNMLWALRLKVYYKMTNEQVISHLFFVNENPDANDPLCSYAFDVLNREVDNYEQWADWRFSEYLNPHEDGEVWSINPMWVEQKLRQEDSKKMLHLFHQNPMTDICLVMFYRLKQQELNCIRAAVEALRLHADREDAMNAAGIVFENL